MSSGTGVRYSRPAFAFRRFPGRAAAAGPDGDGSTADGPRELLRRWLWTRALTLALLLPEATILGDVRYYARQVMALLGDEGIGTVLREYPVPAFAVFLPAWPLGFARIPGYQVAFVLLMLAVDAAFTAALWVGAGRRDTPGLRFWLLFLPCLGPLAFTRFDLVSAALAGSALVALGSRAAGGPVRAGALMAAGAAVKLWPVVLLPGMLVRGAAPAGPRSRFRLLGAFVGVAVLALGLTLAVADTRRLLSPVSWQGERGLQIESVFAVPLMWARSVRPDLWSTPYTQFFAFQVEGPGAAALATLSTVATGAAVLLLGWLWWRALRPGRPTLPAEHARALAVLLGTAGAALLILVNKTLSPQYLVWLGGMLAALGVLAPGEPLLRRAGRLLMVACVLTQVLYPPLYGLLTGNSWASPIGVAMLTVRDALLIRLAVLLVGRVVQLTAVPARDGTAARIGPV